MEFQSSYTLTGTCDIELTENGQIRAKEGLKKSLLWAPKIAKRKLMLRCSN